MSRRARYLLTWPLANVRHAPWTSLASIIAVGAAAYIAATLFGFVTGYQQATEEDVDRLGYDLLITAKGCPYEAATLMLRGGVGLQYMPAGVVTRIGSEAEVAATFPMLIHPIRSPGDDAGMVVAALLPIGARQKARARRAADDAAVHVPVHQAVWHGTHPDAGARQDGLLRGLAAHRGHVPRPHLRL